MQKQISINNDIPINSAPVHLTEKAAKMVKEAMIQEDLQEHALRVGIIGGGCSGLQYLLDFSKTSVSGDFETEFFGIPVYVDPFSAGHLSGTTIDYVDGLNGSGFKFENPNIVRSCGCGSSFTT